MMILEGALPAQIDKVMFDFGLAMGPFAMSDMVLIWVGGRKMVGGSNEVTVISDELCELGRYGQKNGDLSIRKRKQNAIEDKMQTS